MVPLLNKHFEISEHVRGCVGVPEVSISDKAVCTECDYTAASYAVLRCDSLLFT